MAWRSRDDPAGAHEAWKYTTKRKTTDYARRLARELGEYKRVDSVTADELRRLLADGLKPMRNGAVIKGRETSRKMRSYYAATLRGIFAYALAQGWTDLDPAADLPAYWARRKRADDPLRRGDEFLTPDVVRSWSSCAPGTPRSGDWIRAGPSRTPRWQSSWRWRACARARRLAPRWDDVDLGRLSLHIVEGHSMGVTDTPKSRAARTVPLAEEVGRALAGVGLGGVMTGPRDLVFVAPNGGHVDLTTFRARFYAAQDRAGVKPRRDVRQLRNTFGTVCASAGVPLRTLQQWMGHESITTTEIYASFMPRTKTPPRSPARSRSARRSRQRASLNRRVAEHAATPFPHPLSRRTGVVAARARPNLASRAHSGDFILGSGRAAMRGTWWGRRRCWKGEEVLPRRDERNENNDNNRNENDDDTEWTERDRATGEKDESDRNVLRWSAQSGSSI